jgi:hypothetical protein
MCRGRLGSGTMRTGAGLGLNSPHQVPCGGRPAHGNAMEIHAGGVPPEGGLLRARRQQSSGWRSWLVRAARSVLFSEIRSRPPVSGTDASGPAGGITMEGAVREWGARAPALKTRWDTWGPIGHHVVRDFALDQLAVRVDAGAGGPAGTITVMVWRPLRMRWRRRYSRGPRPARRGLLGMALAERGPGARAGAAGAAAAGRDPGANPHAPWRARRTRLPPDRQAGQPDGPWS